MLPTNVADWTDADWELHELQTAAADDDRPTCTGCSARTYDLLPSLKARGDVCMGCARREDRELR